MKKELVNTLSLKEMAGTITEEEKALLHQNITESEEARLIYDHIKAGIERFPMHQVPVEERANVILNAPSRSAVRLMYLRRTAAAAAVLLLLGGGYALWNKNHTPLSQTTGNPTPPAGIQLTLSSGKQVTLGQAAGSLALTNNTLQVSGTSVGIDGGNVAKPEWVTISVPNGREYKLTLLDGTTVWLNAASSIRFPIPFSGNSRELIASGEVYFNVAKDAVRPFMVSLPHSTIKVLGTEFNVNTYEKGREVVALVKGAVAFREDGDSVILKPGLMGTASGSGHINVRSFDADDVLAWQKGEQSLEAEQIGDIAIHIERAFAVPVQIDGTPANFPEFNGSMERKEGLEFFLYKLKAANIIRGYYYAADSTLHLK